MKIDLSGRVAIVTGGSRGIGAEIALVLAECGANVTVTARDAAALDGVTTRLEREHGVQALSVAHDLREPGAPADVVARTVERFGRLDILVNNAGATRRGDFLELGDEDYLDGFALKFHAAVRFCRAAWPQLRANGGQVINIGGIGANTPTADFTVGAPVNAAVATFSKALADRGINDGVRVNAIHPGHIITDRLHRRVAQLASDRNLSLDDAMRASVEESGVPRFGEPREIAAMVAFLCSEHGSYVQGAIIDIDGGASRGM
ncbi:MAG: SDR family oxidoreductase [Gammaproteobacteria bacterium]|nr:SDR family oxidoreductase [Gammaproteobacteria bacterium]